MKPWRRTQKSMTTKRAQKFLMFYYFKKLERKKERKKLHLHWKRPLLTFQSIHQCWSSSSCGRLELICLFFYLRVWICFSWRRRKTNSNFFLSLRFLLSDLKKSIPIVMCDKHTKFVITVANMIMLIECDSYSLWLQLQQQQQQQGKNRCSSTNIEIYYCFFLSSFALKRKMFHSFILMQACD